MGISGIWAGAGECLGATDHLGSLHGQGSHVADGPGDESMLKSMSCVRTCLSQDWAVALQSQGGDSSLPR